MSKEKNKQKTSLLETLARGILKLYVSFPASRKDLDLSWTLQGNAI